MKELEVEIDYGVKDAGLFRHPEQKGPVPLPALAKPQSLVCVKQTGC